MSQEDLIRAAIKWAEDGIPVFPCGSNKSPLTEHGFLDAVSDPAKVRQLFEFYGNQAQMIGGRMGDGIFAVDVDLYKGDAPKQWLEEKIKDGTLPDTRTHETKSGGLHFLYEGEAQSCKPTEGVEVKGEGGYVILPGSPGYKVVKEGVVQAPQSLLDLIKSRASSRGSSQAQLETAIMSGADFHDSLTQLAAKLAAQGQDQVQIQERLVRLLKASTAAEPGHERHARWRAIMSDKGGELSRISNSAYTKFNDEAIMDEAREVASGSIQLGDFDDILIRVFQPPKNFEPQQAPTKYEEDKWPFEGQGYFAEEDHNLTDVDFVLYPIFAENETVVLFAEPKTGKTALALSTALHISCGMDFGALKVSKGGPCLYYALEGSRAIRLRVASWRKKMIEKDVKIPDHIPLFVVEKPANFLKEAVREEAAAQIIAANNYTIKHEGSPLRAIYIDTLTKAMSGGDQNSVEDTSALFEVVNLIRVGGVTATIVFIHHKARQGHVRGSSNIEAEPDILLDVTKKDTIVSMKVSRARSIEDGAAYHFVISEVDLGKTKQGHALKGMFVEPIEGDLQGRDHDDAAEIQLIAQRRSALVELGDNVSAEDAIQAWFAAGLIKGKTIRGSEVMPPWQSPDCQEALHKVARDAGGSIYGNYIIRPQIVGREVTGFKIGIATF